MDINRPIHVSDAPATQPAMPLIRVPEDLKADTVISLIHQSIKWKLPDWTDAELVLSRASLKHVLQRVEAEMGSRKLMPPSRGTR